MQHIYDCIFQNIKWNCCQLWECLTRKSTNFYIELPKLHYILPFCALPKQKLQNIQIKLLKNPIEILTHTLIESQWLMQTGPNMSAGYYGFHAPKATAFNTSKLNYNCHNNLDPIHAHFWHFHSKTKGSPKTKTFISQIKSLGSNSVSTYENLPNISL